MANEPARESDQPTESVAERVLELRFDQLTRRQVLSLLGGGTAAAVLAACGGASPTATTAATTAPTRAATTAAAASPTAARTTASPAGGATSASPTTAATTAAQPTTAPQTSGKKGGTFNGAWPFELPPAGHFNMFMPKAISLGVYRELLDSAMAFYSWADNKYIPILAEKWGFEGADTFAVTLKPNLKWSDGTPLTSKDVVATFTARHLYAGQMFQYVDRVEAKDDRTVTFRMNRPSTVVERYVLREFIVPASIFGQLTDKAAALYAQGKDNTADEIKAIRKDFDPFRPDKYLSSGPFVFDPKTMTEASAQLLRNPNGVNADVVRFDKIFLYNGETPLVTPLVLTKDIDYATHGFAVATDKQMQAQGIRVLRTTTHGGQAITFNFANPKLKVINDKRVRQAFAHAVDRKSTAAVVYAESGRVPKYMAGFVDQLVEKWVPPGDLAKLNQYPFDRQKAADLMIAAGCKKQGDQWMDPDGKPMAYELMTPAEYQDQSATAQDWADQMTTFGVKISVRAISFTQVPVERREGKFELTTDGWGTGNPHPHFSLVATLLNKVQPLALGPYTSFNLKQKTDIVGEVDFQQLITDSALGLDIEKQKAAIGKAALAFNEQLPVLQVIERLMNGPALEGVRVTGWPPDGDPIYQNSPYSDSFVSIMIFNGRLGPV